MSDAQVYVDKIEWWDGLESREIQSRPVFHPGQPMFVEVADDVARVEGDLVSLVLSDGEKVDFVVVSHRRLEATSWELCMVRST